MNLLISVTVAENNDWINAILANFQKFIHVPYFVCINTHEHRTLDIPNNVYFTSPINKPHRGGNGILNGIYENLRYAIEHSIPFDYVVILASNCMFIKPFTKSSFLNLNYWSSQVSGTIPVDFTKSFGGYHNIYDSYYNRMMEKQKWTDAYFHQWEGLIFTKDLCQKIVEILHENEMFNEIRNGVAQEEAYFPTILWNLCLKNASRINPMCEVDNICRFFWELPNYTPNIRQIEETDTRYLCVKRIERNINNPIYQYIMNL